MSLLSGRGGGPLESVLEYLPGFSMTAVAAAAGAVLVAGAVGLFLTVCFCRRGARPAGRGPKRYGSRHTKFQRLPRDAPDDDDFDEEGSQLAAYSCSGRQVNSGGAGNSLRTGTAGAWGGRVLSGQGKPGSAKPKGKAKPRYR